MCLGALMSVCIAISACSYSGGENDGKAAETEIEDVFVPVTDKGEASELYAKYTECRENAELAFVGADELSAEHFEYEAHEGEITIKKYIGDEIVAVVPDEIEGRAVTAISSGAFSGGSVRAVYIPDSVKYIEKKAFDNCQGLATLRLPFVGDGVENSYIGYVFGASEPDANAVAIPQSLKLVIVGEGCMNISDEAFRRAKSLEAVVFEGEIESIGKLAFYECAELVYIDIEALQGDIGEYAFAFCRSLYSADASNAKNIEKGAFYSCSSLHDMKLVPREGDFLGRYFGAQTADFNDEFVPSSLRVVTVADGSSVLPDRFFSSCKYLTGVILPEGLENIGVRSFYLCRSLVSLDIPDSVRNIRDDAFFGCDAMKKIELGTSLENIGMQAFFGCEALTCVEFPMSLEKIGASAFYGCTSLQNVAFNGSEEIGKDAFSGCPTLIEQKENEK